MTREEAERRIKTVSRYIAGFTTTPPTWEDPT
jgi:hypothetical protein